MRCQLLAFCLCFTPLLSGPAPAADGEPPAVVTRGHLIELRSPSFVVVLSTTRGLGGVSWENRLTGHKLSLAGGPEVEFDIGRPGQALATPKLLVTRRPAEPVRPGGEAVFELSSDEPRGLVTITYQWNATDPVLHKRVSITNRGSAAWDRLLNVRLGTYAGSPGSEVKDPDFPIYVNENHMGGSLVAVEDPAGSKRGFPAYLEGQFFLSLAHPAGFATRNRDGIMLRQMPGVRLGPGERFDCMEAVYGVSQPGQARKAFRDHLLGRMRRVRRGHDKPLAIFEPFGAKPDGDFWTTEAFLLDNLGKLAEARRQCGLQWDYYSLEFWHDPAGDLKTPDAKRFPRGFSVIMPEIGKLGMKPGLWIDSGMIGSWTFGANPVVKGATTRGGVSLCRAAEPVGRLYREAFAHQIQENGVRLLKFDNFLDRCDETTHGHLPGDYSTEAICNAVIEDYRALDRVWPDVFIMLYWNYQSPWWLEHADTLFDAGTKIEAASFASWPTFRARDSVTRRLDQARWVLKDIPPLGWDPLGIWLSDWPWNSRVGKEAWQTGLAMDLCRGHLLAQLWSDTPVLTGKERAQAAEFIALLRARPECFRNSRFILGNPWRNEPYGYACTDGKRAFLAINNGVWRDTTITLDLGPAWGLPEGQRWDLYRWYPHPARLSANGEGFASGAKLALRPMEIVLLEAVPHGHVPSLNRGFDVQPIPEEFREPSRRLAVNVVQPPSVGEKQTDWTVLEVVEARSKGGATLTRLADGSILASGDNPSPDAYFIQASTGLRRITAVRLEAMPDDRLPQRGPGRAENGNFTVLELSVSAASRDNPTALQPIRFQRADASFSQISHGGWPVTATIDGNPRTGWGIDPQEGQRHEAVFELQQPIEFSAGVVLNFQIDQFERGHNLGRFRLSATSSAPPISVAKPATRRLYRGELPPTRSGGVLAVSVELQKGPRPFWIHHRPGLLEAKGSLNGQSAAFEPVVGDGNYPAPWQTWRLAVKSSQTPQPFELQVTSMLPSDVERRFSAWFVPEP